MTEPKDEAFSPQFRQYTQMLEMLRAVRLKHDGKESIEEDRLLDQMDGVWVDLRPNERDRLSRAGDQLVVEVEQHD